MSSGRRTTVGIMATYPARWAQLPVAIRSVALQVDTLYVVLNEFSTVPDWMGMYANVFPIIPDSDLKDVGKFALDLDADSYVALFDDDLEYPADYVASMRNAHKRYEDIDAIVGMHGVIYPEFWDGNFLSRMVYTFSLGRNSDALVNQLGTGTVFLSGRQMPPLSYMAGSAGFVDVRFARYAWENDRPLVCVERHDTWLRQIDVGESLYASVTQKWSSEILKEVMSFGGLSKLGRFSHAFHGISRSWHVPASRQP